MWIASQPNAFIATLFAGLVAGFFLGAHAVTGSNAAGAKHDLRRRAWRDRWLCCRASHAASGLAVSASGLAASASGLASAQRQRQRQR
jgi:hypothetical protein